MASILAFLLAVALWAFPTYPTFAIAAPVPQPLGAIPGLSQTFAGQTPELGIQDGQLLPCPSTPNCIVSQGADQDHAIAPIAYTGGRDEARELLTKEQGHFILKMRGSCSGKVHDDKIAVWTFQSLTYSTNNKANSGSKSIFIQTD